MAKYPSEPLSGITAADLGWLSGNWRGQLADNIIEEVWSGPEAGTLVGMFRWIQGDRVRFYELLVVESGERGLVLRIKHFNPGLKGWEEKDEAVNFDLVALAGQEATFLRQGGEEPLWMVYRREGRANLIAYFAKEGQEFDPVDAFRYTLVN
jgi:hypothetical protein